MLKYSHGAECVLLYVYNNVPEYQHLHIIEAKANKWQVKTSIQISCLQAYKELFTEIKKKTAD